MNTWGEKLRLSIFGESHGGGIGIVMDGLPPGFAPDMEEVAAEMARRAPGQSALTTARRESDTPEILSGLFNGTTTGAPLAVIIRNTDTRSRDYTPELPRPGHADWPAQVKFEGYQDYRGGGHFSGRLTAPLVFAGAIAKQILREQYRVSIGSKILRMAGETGQAAMEQAVLAAKADGDSVGGVIEAWAEGLPVGRGNPFFGGVESRAASLLFSIPAVKGVEFGDGFALAGMRGSAANDPMRVENGVVTLDSNHNGGALGGLTNGQPLVVRVAIKPTPSVSKPQQMVNLTTMETVQHSTLGRHDPCIVPRALPVVEAALALCITDLML